MGYCKQIFLLAQTIRPYYTLIPAVDLNVSFLLLRRRIYKSVLWSVYVYNLCQKYTSDKDYITSGKNNQYTNPRMYNQPVNTIQIYSVMQSDGNILKIGIFSRMYNFWTNDHILIQKPLPIRV